MPRSIVAPFGFVADNGTLEMENSAQIYCEVHLRNQWKELLIPIETKGKWRMEEKNRIVRSY